jgi:hypothetical protein
VVLLKLIGLSRRKICEGDTGKNQNERPHVGPAYCGSILITIQRISEFPRLKAVAAMWLDSRFFRCVAFGHRGSTLREKIG